MIHLVTAWKTPARSGDPEVLYCGLDGRAAKAAAAAAPAEYLRVESAMVTESYKIKRRGNPPVAANHAASTAPAEPPPPSALRPPPSEEQPSGESDGPEVKLDPAPSRKKK